MSINYRVQKTLTKDQNPNASYEEEIDGNLLVADFILFSYRDQQSEYGEQYNEIIPCFWNGEKSFLKKWRWDSQAPYCAEGGGEEILSFEKGVKLLLEKGAFEWMFQDVKKED